MSIRGKRVRLITIEKQTTTYNDYNEPVKSWNPAVALTETDHNGQVYAEQHSKGGDEGMKDGQVLAWSKTIWKLPMIEDLNERDYRIEWNGKVFDIETIWPLRRNNLMVKTKQQDNQ